jgi:hypothetical protein
VFLHTFEDLKAAEQLKNLDLTDKDIATLAMKVTELYEMADMAHQLGHMVNNISLSIDELDER